MIHQLPRHNYTITRFTRQHGYEATETIEDNNDMVHASLRSDYTTGILLGFLQALLLENVRGFLEPVTRGKFPELQWVSSE